MLSRDAAVILHLLRGQRRNGTLQERLERFYAPQARHYDQFRERLLRGRDQLLDNLALAPGQHVVELGCGTGRNLGFIEPEVLQGLARLDLVDLCPALLAEATRRCRGVRCAHLVEADATRFDPGRAVDRVYLSYSLSMMPDWQAVLRNAYRMLKPGGLLGVVDFGLPLRAAGDERASERFLRAWFGHDGVDLDPARQGFLGGLFQPLLRLRQRSRVPYLPWLRAPWYLFVGRK